MDANVVIYPWDAREKAKGSRARAVLDALIAQDVIVYSTQTVGEFFRGISRRIPNKLPPDLAASIAADMAMSYPVLGITSAVTLEALAGSVRYGFSYWDAQLWATAKVHSVPIILSEDFADGCVVEGVRFVNPFTPEFDVEALIASL